MRGELQQGVEDGGCLPSGTSYGGSVLGSLWLEMVCTVGNVVPALEDYMRERKEEEEMRYAIDEPQRWSESLRRGNALSQIE